MKYWMILTFLFSSYTLAETLNYNGDYKCAFTKYDRNNNTIEEFDEELTVYDVVTPVIAKVFEADSFGLITYPGEHFSYEHKGMKLFMQLKHLENGKGFLRVTGLVPLGLKYTNEVNESNLTLLGKDLVLYTGDKSFRVVSDDVEKGTLLMGACSK